MRYRSRDLDYSGIRFFRNFTVHLLCSAPSTVQQSIKNDGDAYFFISKQSPSSFIPANSSTVYGSAVPNLFFSFRTPKHNISVDSNSHYNCCPNFFRLLQIANRRYVWIIYLDRYIILNVFNKYETILI